MSMGMQVYLVDEAEVKAVPGSNDAELLQKLLDREGQRESLEWFDEEMEHLIEDDCPGFTHADALRDIFAGRVTHPEAGFVYQNAFEHVCSSLGEWVHDTFHRCNPEWVERLDKLLESHGVGLRFYGGLVEVPPVPLPRDRYGGGLGHWTRVDILAAAPAFRALLAANPDPEVRLYLEEIGQWISKVEAKPGSMLVASYS
jgi:hypothetical protein